MSSLQRPDQLRSGLGNLKRSWSGNAHDLGAATTDSAPAKSASGPASSQEIFYDWSPSPPYSASARPAPGKENMLPDAKRRKSDEATNKSAFVSASSLVPPRSNSVPSRNQYNKGSDSLADSFSRARNPGKSQPLMENSQGLNRPAGTWSRSSTQSLLSQADRDLMSVGVRQKAVNKIFLSAEQRTVLKMVVDDKKNVFFTGSAGTGKSVLLREIIQELRHKYSKKTDAVAVTASTGIAACNIGGVTVHSFSGVGLGKEPAAHLVSKIRKNRKSMSRWTRTQVLIIDEISMVDPDLFDKLEEIARTIRKSDKPFGGLQVVITGDFFQLPPVNPGGGMTFAFEAKSWESVVSEKVNLTQVFRQKDSTFVTMLNEMRFGKLSQDTIARFRQLERVPNYDETIVPTELFPRREEVDRANFERLNALKTPAQTYPSVDSGSLDGEQRERVLSNFMALKSLCLKEGAQVMLIKNIDETLVNGSIGKVIGFMSEKDYTEGGMNRDDREPDKQNKLSRTGIMVRWPLVRFRLPNGNARDWLAKPESWKNELPSGEVQASRTQVPLILAWAMSIHKSQGQTLPCCKIDLNRVFEKGQAYVALSRATSIEGLQVLGFNPAKVMAHPKVISWSRTLLAVQK